jgi:glycine dehydrogenase subunit 1
MTLLEALTRVDGLERTFSGAHFHEFVVRLKTPVAPMLAGLKARGVIGGFDLGRDYPELGHALLACATETKSEADIRRYAECVEGVIARRDRPAQNAIRTDT